MAFGALRVGDGRLLGAEEPRQVTLEQPLVMTGAGNGIAAKFIEQGGVDILGVYNTGYFRMQGYGSLAGMRREMGRP